MKLKAKQEDQQAGSALHDAATGFGDSDAPGSGFGDFQEGPAAAYYRPDSEDDPWATRSSDNAQVIEARSTIFSFWFDGLGEPFRLTFVGCTVSIFIIFELIGRR